MGILFGLGFGPGTRDEREVGDEGERGNDIHASVCASVCVGVCVGAGARARGVYARVERTSSPFPTGFVTAATTATATSTATATAAASIIATAIAMTTDAAGTSSGCALIPITQMAVTGVGRANVREQLVPRLELLVTYRALLRHPPGTDQAVSVGEGVASERERKSRLDCLQSA